MHGDNRCAKKCYIKKKEAKAAMKSLKREKKFDLQTIYFCNECTCWHTTSMDKQQSRNITKRSRK